MDKLNIAIIGCGWAGERHFRALKKLSDRASVSALVDIDEEFLRERVREWDLCNYK